MANLRSVVHPPRSFHFTVQGVVPANVLSDEELQMFLVAVRNLILGQMAAGISAVPTDEQTRDITIAPYVGPGVSNA